MRFSPERIRRAVFRKVSGISRNADGNRLNLGNFDGTGLNCNNWNYDDDANDNLGVCALMMGKTISETSRQNRDVSKLICSAAICRACARLYRAFLKSVRIFPRPILWPPRAG